MQEYFYTKEEIDQMLLDFDIGSFTDLQTLITSASSGNTLILDKNYKYDSTTDSSLTNGIEITKDITIIGNGYIIDGNNSQRAFYINGQYTFNLSDVRIQNCSGNNGGAIYAWRSTVNINNITFNQNTATVDGGAIDTGADCNLTITNCTFNQNTAREGGAIYNNHGTLNVTNCTFNQNTANHGGAMCSDGALTMIDCTFEDNVANMSYANIYSNNEITVYDCIIPDISTSCYNVTNKIRTFINYIDAPTSATPNSSYTISAKVTDINDDPISDIYVDLERSGYTLYRIRTDEDGIVSYTGTANNTFTYSMSVEGDNTYESSDAGEKTLIVT